MAVPKLADYPLSPKEAADYVGVHVDTIKAWARDGKVRAFCTPGGWWRFSTDDLDAFLTPSPIEAKARSLAADLSARIPESADGEPVERPA